MQRRDTPQFGRVLDFLEGIHEQVPELLCYRHYAKLSAGLRGKMVLNMVEQRCPLMDILKALNCHFPPACPDDPSTVRNISLASNLFASSNRKKTGYNFVCALKGRG
ncbi:hypothetical protein FKM82_003752 [Ascaphus truei]